MNTKTAKRPFITLPSDRSGRRELAVRIALTLLVMAAPLLVTLALTLPRGVNPFSALPRWSDESWWYAQYGAMSRFGRPLGYFGYHGKHAAWGTFGPWGMYPLLLTGGLSRIFGWGLHAFVYYNYFFLAASSLFFILLTKPDRRGLLCLAAANAMAYVAIAYAVICMNEVVRYAMALVLSGVMVRLIRQPECSRGRLILRCTVIPLLLAYATSFYIILGVFIFIYCWLMLRRLKPVWRILIALAVTAAAVFLLRELSSATACPYPSGDRSYGRALPQTLQFRISNLFFRILDSIQNIDLFYLVSGVTSSEPLFVWFCVMIYLLMGILIWRLIANAKRPEKRTVFLTDLMGLVLLCAFVGGHIVLYDTNSWTFIRGCFTAVYCIIMVGALSPREDAQPWRAAIILCLLGAFSFASIYTTLFSTADRFSTPEKDARWNDERQALEQVIELDPHAADPWENTVVLLGEDDDIYFVLPWGVGVNGAVDDVLNVDAKYVLVGHGYELEETREARLQTLQESGHRVVYESEDYTVLVNAAKFG